MSVSRRGSFHSSPKYPRVARVNKLLLEIVAEAIERYSDDDPRLELTTVTYVDTEPDLSSAVVWIADLNDDRAAALEEYRPRIQRSVAAQVRMKRTPHLRFAQDEGIIRGGRIDEILRRLSSGYEEQDGE